MSERFIERMDKITSEFPNSSLTSEFVARANEGQPTIDENPISHFCVYFAGFDPETKKVFIGHHKKADQWLFNGGHIDRGGNSGRSIRTGNGRRMGNNN
jgi:hypothetical protein